MELTKDQAKQRLLEIKKEEQALLNIINISGKPIIDRVKDMDDIFREAGIVKEAFYKSFEGRTPGDIALKEMELISSVLNEGYSLSDTDERYLPWFDIEAGFVFDGTVYPITRSAAGLGPRLCFKSEELADFAGKTFTHIYKKFYYNM